MKKILSGLIVASLLLIGCGFSPREVGVRDVTKNETIVLTKRPSQGAITNLRITGRGSLDGKVEVQLMLNGAAHKKEAVGGNVSFDWNGDWYADQAEVRYIAGTATSGTLMLKYEFR